MADKLDAIESPFVVFGERLMGEKEWKTEKKLLIPRKEKRHKFELNLIKWETIAHKDQLRHLLFLTHNFFSS